MSDDIVERLMICAKYDPDQKEAAGEIKRLRAERETLRGLLKKARPYVYGKTITDRELEEEIDAALKKEGE